MLVKQQLEQSTFLEALPVEALRFHQSQALGVRRPEERGNGGILALFHQVLAHRGLQGLQLLGAGGLVGQQELRFILGANCHLKSKI